MTMKPWKTPLPEEPKEYTLRCTHQKLWPPPLVKLGVDIRAMWRSGEIEQHDYQQVETWEKVCGQIKMGEKCLTCPLAKVVLPVPGQGQSAVNVEPLGDWIKKRAAQRAKAAHIAKRGQSQVSPEPAQVSPEPAPVEPGPDEEMDIERLLDE